MLSRTSVYRILNLGEAWQGFLMERDGLDRRKGGRWRGRRDRSFNDTTTTTTTMMMPQAPLFKFALEIERTNAFLPLSHSRWPSRLTHPWLKIKPPHGQKWACFKHKVPYTRSRQTVSYGYWILCNFLTNENVFKTSIPGYRISPKKTADFWVAPTISIGFAENIIIIQQEMTDTSLTTINHVSALPLPTKSLFKIIILFMHWLVCLGTLFSVHRPANPNQLTTFMGLNRYRTATHGPLMRERRRSLGCTVSAHMVHFWWDERPISSRPSELIYLSSDLAALGEIIESGPCQNKAKWATMYSGTYTRIPSPPLPPAPRFRWVLSEVRRAIMPRDMTNYPMSTA